MDENPPWTLCEKPPKLTPRPFLRGEDLVALGDCFCGDGSLRCDVTPVQGRYALLSDLFSQCHAHVLILASEEPQTIQWKASPRNDTMHAHHGALRRGHWPDKLITSTRSAVLSTSFLGDSDSSKGTYPPPGGSVGVGEVSISGSGGFGADLERNWKQSVCDRTDDQQRRAAEQGYKLRQLHCGDGRKIFPARHKKLHAAVASCCVDRAHVHDEIKTGDNHALGLLHC